MATKRLVHDLRLNHKLLEKGNEDREYESKFRVRALPDGLEKQPHDEISQGYVALSEGGKEVRVRKKGNQYFRTIKVDKDDISAGRPEDEKPITRQLFESLWPYAKGKIEKTRYYIRHGERVIELDIFHGDASGKVLAEVEFPGREEKAEYKPPEWLGERVLDTDRRYRNGYMSIHGVPNDLLLKTDAPQWVLELDEGLKQIIREIGTRMLTTPDPIFVGIAGGSASGKSSMVAKRLQEAFGADAIVISMDDYYRPLKEVEALPKIGSIPNFDTPDALRLEQLYEHLLALKKGKTIQKPVYSKKLSGPLPTKESLTPHKIVLVEGLYPLDEDHFGDMFDFKVFVQASDFSQFIRRLVRDTRETSLTPTQTTTAFFTVALPGQRKYVDPTRVNADIILVNEYNPNMEPQANGIIDNQVKFRTKVSESSLIGMRAQLRMGATQFDEHYRPRINGPAPDFVRLRTENDTPIFTYKGPPFANIDPRKQARVEFRFGGAPTELRQWIREVCGEQIATVSKHRVSYQYSGVTINIDTGVRVRRGKATHSANLGDFVEICYLDEEEKSGKVQEVISGLNLRDPIKENYYEMI